jgi:uncharacterized protein (DUF305 family)
MATHTITSLVAAGTLALTIGAGLGGCGTSNNSTNGHNAVDITFAQNTIQHHAQAIAMSRVGVQRGSSQVKDLAARIQAAQQPEIEQLRDRLHAWNVAVPATDSPMEDMDHGDTHAMPGMISSDQMRQLGQVPADKFDLMFLRMMTAHHKGAITMARSELSDGQNTDTRQLAQRIIDTQQREITEMQAFPGT